MILCAFRRLWSPIKTPNMIFLKNGTALAIGWRGGVVLLGSPRTHANISVWQKDAVGRLVSLLITYENVSINLVNIYAPTYPREKEDLFPIFRPFLFS